MYLFRPYNSIDHSDGVSASGFKIRGFILTFFYCFLYFSSISLQAQNSNIITHFSRDSIVIGEPISLDITISIPKGSYDIKWPEIKDSLPNFTISKVDSVTDTTVNNGQLSLSKRIYITSFDSGTQMLRPLTININKIGKDSSFQLMTDGHQIEVGYAKDDGVRPYHDIKSVIAVKNALPNWVKYLIAGIIILTLLIIYLIKRRKKKLLNPVLSDSKDIYKNAIEKINQLKVEVNQGAESNKYYFTRLLDIFKNYLSSYTGNNVLSATSSELILELHHLITDKDLFTHVANSINLSDAVMFAKFETTKDDMLRNIDEIENGTNFLHKKEAK